MSLNSTPVSPSLRAAALLRANSWAAPGSSSSVLMSRMRLRLLWGWGWGWGWGGQGGWGDQGDGVGGGMLRTTPILIGTGWKLDTPHQALLQTDPLQGPPTLLTTQLMSPPPPSSTH